MNTTAHTAAERAPRPDRQVKIAELALPSPVMPASGCFGPELAAFLGPDDLGATVTKTVFAEARSGNPGVRIVDLYTGMLNSVGIPSLGIDGFVESVLPGYRQWNCPLIASIGGVYDRDYADLVSALHPQPIAAWELNFSCPNVDHGMVGTSPQAVASVLSQVRAVTDRPLLVKLTPAVASIAEIALAAQQAGADAVTVCNSFPALAVDAESRSAILGRGNGGYTGRGVKPLALRLVNEAAQAVDIPVIGCGGISTGIDAAEFLIAGATAVQVGTATFSEPDALRRITAELTDFAAAQGLERISELTGTLRPPVWEESL